jgi:hypothetical protein
LNILTHGFQSIVIQQQSTQYVNPDEPAHSEDDESAQMKESVRYKNGIMQFIENFKQNIRNENVMNKYIYQSVTEISPRKNSFTALCSVIKPVNFTCYLHKLSWSILSVDSEKC